MGHVGVPVSDANVIVQDVDPSKTIDTGLRQTLALILSRHIGLKGEGFAPLLSNHRPGILSRVEASVYQKHPRTLTGVDDSRSASITNRVTRCLSGADDDCHFAFESITHSVLLS